MIHGVDVSYVQRGACDFRKVKASGFDFVWVKATEGNAGKDPAFQDLSKAALDAGLLVGAYAFARPSTDDQDAARELENLYAACKDLGLQLRPALDLESTKLSGKATFEWMTTWAWLAYTYWGNQMPVLYTGAYMYESFGDVARGAEWVKQMPIWLAQYPIDYTKSPIRAREYVVSELSKPRVPRPWERWSMWQYSGTGGRPVPGVKVDCDRNVYNGTLAEFMAEMMIPGPLKAA